jgi:hypothetical protein
MTARTVVGGQSDQTRLSGTADSEWQQISAAWRLQDLSNL